MLRAVWRRALGRVDRPRVRANPGGDGESNTGKEKLSPYEIEDAEFEDIKDKD
jgi:hypothetical protein